MLEEPLANVYGCCGQELPGRLRIARLALRRERGLEGLAPGLFVRALDPERLAQGPADLLVGGEVGVEHGRTSGDRGAGQNDPVRWREPALARGQDRERAEAGPQFGCVFEQIPGEEDDRAARRGVRIGHVFEPPIGREPAQERGPPGIFVTGIPFVERAAHVGRELMKSCDPIVRRETSRMHEVVGILLRGDRTPALVQLGLFGGWAEELARPMKVTRPTRHERDRRKAGPQRRVQRCGRLVLALQLPGQERDRQAGILIARERRQGLRDELGGASHERRSTPRR